MAPLGEMPWKVVSRGQRTQRLEQSRLLRQCRMRPIKAALQLTGGLHPPFLSHFLLKAILVGASGFRGCKGSPAPGMGHGLVALS